MELIKIRDFKKDSNKLNKAVNILQSGGLVIFPTETVYGLGANANIPKAVSKVYNIKKRPESKPLSLHIADIEFLLNYVDKISLDVWKLANEFWPGPLTIIIQTKFGLKGFRMPKNPIALALIRKSGIPVVASSANVTGVSPPVNIEQIPLSIKNKVNVIIDTGKTSIGVESTVLDITCVPFKILRQGVIDKKAIDDALK